MTDEELQAAEARLRGRREFDWLTGDSSSWWRPSQVADGAGVTPKTVRAWCEAGRIPGAVFYGPEMGWRIPRSGLVEFFAGLQRGAGAQAG